MADKDISTKEDKSNDQKVRDVIVSSIKDFRVVKALLTNLLNGINGFEEKDYDTLVEFTDIVVDGALGRLNSTIEWLELELGKAVSKA